MENKKKLYIVSFGNSDKYRYVYTVPEGADALRKPSPFADLERRLSDYLHSRFPADNALAYYTTAKATEVDHRHAQRFRDYPELNEEAIRKIEHTLAKEVELEDDVKKYNFNAPFAKVGEGM